jgi:hypothetical protein
MTNKLYAVYDKLMEEAGPIFEARNDEVAKRMFRNLMKDNPGINREDHTLYSLGSFNRNKLEINFETPLVLNPDYGDTTKIDPEEDGI